MALMGRSDDCSLFQCPIEFWAINAGFYIFILWFGLKIVIGTPELMTASLSSTFS
jgi:hypothetical protein